MAVKFDKHTNIMDEDFRSEFVDEGDGFAPTVSGADEAQAETALKADSADETTEKKPIDAQSVEADIPEGKEVSEAAAKPEDRADDSEQSLDEVFADVDKDIADEKHPKWFKARLEGVKKAFLRETEAVKATYEPLKDFGEVSQIAEDLEFARAIDSFETDPATNLPKATVKPYVDKLVAKGSEKTIAVIQELGNRFSPNGRTYFDELIAAYGLDPNRISDYKQLKANGYQVGAQPDPEELDEIPETLREAFISLSPDERDEILIMSEAVRDRALKGIQSELDTERTKREQETKMAESAAQEDVRQQQEFYQGVNVLTDELAEESGNRIFEAFTSSLVSNDIDELEALGIALTVSAVLNSTGAEAKASLAALEKKGVKIDDALVETFKDWGSAAKAAATFKKQGDEANNKVALNRLKEFETKIIRKGNPIIAGILEHRSKSKSASIETKNSKLANVTNHNNGIGQKGRQEAIAGNYAPADFSDDAFRADAF